jgi:hypothetical protein
LNEALNAFIRTLDRYTLEDLMLKPKDFAPISAKPSPRLRGPQF